MISHFYLHPGILKYTFGEGHPLKPDRVRRTVELLEALYKVPMLGDTVGQVEDVLRVHSQDYVDVVQSLSQLPSGRLSHGFGSMDNPPFEGMYQSSLDYVGSSAAAARAVRDGASLSFGMGGGLHHALRDKASGFCIFNDCAVACHILREKFDRVAYVDIDVHHGDGVQWIFYEDPAVLTCSIHQDGRTIYPGTGHVDEVGAEFSAINVPVAPKTSGDVWLEGFERGILTALQSWKPDAIVLQMGADSHYLDLLGNVNNTQRHWLQAVNQVKALGVPIVALGGGGYTMTTVPRLWVSAILTLAGMPYEDRIPEILAEEWGTPTFSDPAGSVELGVGREHMEKQVEWLEVNHAILS